MATTVADPESVRIKAGLSKAEWDRLVPDKKDSFAVAKIERDLKRFIAGVRKAVDYEFEHPDVEIDGQPYLSVAQASRALGIGEFHLCTLRSREKLLGEKYGRRTVYSRDVLAEFVDPPNGTPRNSALASSFLRWLDLQER